LGKGLGALIPERGGAEAEGKRAPALCGIEEIQPNPLQPRKTFPDEQLQELADSIKEKGILQPLMVRRRGDKFELIAGERRWRAAQRAGMREVPVLVKEVSDSEMLELSLIENIQREDLNPIEEAEAYKRLMEEFDLTQEEVSRKIGKDRTTIANTIRLLKLPPEVKQSLSEGKISMGHARAFLGLDGADRQRALLRRLLLGGLSVRQIENIIKRLRAGSPSSPRKGNPDWSPLVEDLQRVLGTRVKIVGRRKRGKIEIEYYSAEELDRLVEMLKR